MSEAPAIIGMTEYILCGMLVGLAFLLKIVVGKPIVLPDVILGVYELPVDVMFLSSALLVSYFMRSPSNHYVGMIYFLSYIMASVVVVVLWRFSRSLFEKNRVFASFGLASFNFFVCLFAFLRSFWLLKGV